MCGIVGILKQHPRERVESARIRRMRDTLVHRGPDGEGLWLDGPIGLGHRRLAIVDLAGGRQPMSNEDGTIWIVYNGEIYNHAELREELSARGHVYATRCDTETILHLYEELGERCVERLSGMFAFAIWDSRRQRLLLARDRLGIKPLYYACTEHEILFASEIKALLAAGSLRAELNRAVLPEFLATRFVSGDETFFRGVRKLLPGRTLLCAPDAPPRERRYWHPPAAAAEPEPLGLSERAAEVRERLRHAVRSHLMSDVPLGLFLSGGIDSSGLAALVAPLLDEPVRTFSIGFNDDPDNELGYARLVARSVGAEHREIQLGPEQFFGALPRLVWHEDEPIAFQASVPLYFVSRLAQQHVKVVLTGEGADELFLGYNRYRMTVWNERLGSACSRFVPAAFNRLMQGLPRPVGRYTRHTFLAWPPGARSLFYENFAVFPEALQRRLLRDQDLLAARDPYADALRCYGEIDGGTRERMSHADLQTYLVELLMKQDQMSMAASIESRVPYLDDRFVDYVARIPGRFKLRGWRTKAVLREALRDLVPHEILVRKKLGFPVPLSRWLRGPYWPAVEELVLGPRARGRGLFDASVVRRLAEEHRAGRADLGEQLWLLLNLEIWQRIFLDGEDVRVAVGSPACSAMHRSSASLTTGAEIQPVRPTS